MNTILIPLVLVCLTAVFGLPPASDTQKPTLDCELRRLALEYANLTLGPESVSSVFVALNLGPDCGDHLPVHTVTSPAPAPGAEATDIFVSPDGHDAASGSIKDPLATLHRAQTKARGLIQAGMSARVQIREGTYYLSEPLTLTELDSGNVAAPTGNVGRR